MRMARRTGPIATAGLFLLGVLLLAWGFSARLLYIPVFHLFSGEVFSGNRFVTGGALDQPSLHKFYFLFCLFSVLIASLILVIRWMSDREQKAVRLIFCILSFILFLQPLSILTITLVNLVHYISAMGFTPKRAIGLVIGLVGYTAIFAFLFWACELPVFKKVKSPEK